MQSMLKKAKYHIKQTLKHNVGSEWPGFSWHGISCDVLSCIKLRNGAHPVPGPTMITGTSADCGKSTVPRSTQTDTADSAPTWNISHTVLFVGEMAKWLTLLRKYISNMSVILKLLIGNDEICKYLPYIHLSDYACACYLFGLFVIIQSSTKTATFIATNCQWNTKYIHKTKNFHFRLWQWREYAQMTIKHGHRICS